MAADGRDGGRAIRSPETKAVGGRALSSAGFRLLAVFYLTGRFVYTILAL